ncbi:hypothetical protein KTD26_18090, partial [Burkholderia multivorans]|uniref:hypothetical protein n=1 Tax=Burkholderia multivorans TaxID=87883 RepID=UPI001C214E73
DAAYHLAASSQSVRHSVRRAIHRRHQLRSFNRPQHTKFLTRPAMFLYLVINQLRAENHAQVYRIAGGPLILDNPFAKATSPTMWRAQRLLAEAMNVQLIFATALQDFNALGEFQRFIRLRRAGQNSKTRRWHLEFANLKLNNVPEELA